MHSGAAFVDTPPFKDSKPGATMSIQDDNKALALRWVAASVAGDVAATRALFADDCKILIVGDMPFCGWMSVDDFFKQTLILPLGGPITFEVGDLVAEANKVWFEAQSSASLKDGGNYQNVYIFQLTIRDSLIVEYKEFGDTLHAWRMIDAPETRGDAIARQALLTSVSARFVGGAISESLRE